MRGLGSDELGESKGQVKKEIWRFLYPPGLDLYGSFRRCFWAWYVAGNQTKIRATQNPTCIEFLGVL